MVGVMTSFIGVVGFTFFVTIYLNLNDALMEAIRQDS
jgi:preprotein translocase subunit SecE